MQPSRYVMMPSDTLHNMSRAKTVRRRLGGASSAVQLFGRLVVLETHTLRY